MNQEIRTDRIQMNFDPSYDLCQHFIGLSSDPGLDWLTLKCWGSMKYEVTTETRTIWEKNKNSSVVKWRPLNLWTYRCWTNWRLTRKNGFRCVYCLAVIFSLLFYVSPSSLQHILYLYSKQFKPFRIQSEPACILLWDWDVIWMRGCVSKYVFQVKQMPHWKYKPRNY